MIRCRLQQTVSVWRASPCRAITPCVGVRPPSAPRLRWRRHGCGILPTPYSEHAALRRDARVRAEAEDGETTTDPLALEIARECTLPDVRKMCRAAGVIVTGNKPWLCERLADHMRGRYATINEMRTALLEEESKVAKKLRGPQKEAEDRGKRSDADDGEARRKSLEEGYKTMKLAELRELCRSLSLNSDGKKAELVARLTDAAAAAASGQDIGGDEQPPSGSSAVVQALFEKSAAELREECADAGLSTGGRKIDLINRMAAHQAGMAAARSEGGKARAKDAGRTSFNVASIDKMKVNDLRTELENRGLSAEGKAAELKARLTAAVMLEKETASETTMPSDSVLRSMIEQEVMGMDEDGLVHELASRGLSTEGGAMELQQRLARALLIEAQGEAGTAQRAAAQQLEAQQPQLMISDFVFGYKPSEDPTTTVAVLFGGGGSEDIGMSLTVARALLNHLRTCPYPEELQQLQEIDDSIEAKGVSVVCFFMDTADNVWEVPASLVHALSAADFNFGPPESARQLADLPSLMDEIKVGVDVVFPAVFGAFGQGGGLQLMLEEAGIEYVGTRAASASVAYDKWESNTLLTELDYPTVPMLRLDAAEFGDFDKMEGLVSEWWDFMKLAEDAQVIVKPSTSGSTVGLLTAVGVKEVVAYTQMLSIVPNMTGTFVVEPRVYSALEYSCVVIETDDGPKALMPTTILLEDPEDDIIDHEMAILEYEYAKTGVKVVRRNVPHPDDESKIFDRRKKMFPSTQVRMTTPPMLPADVIIAIQESAESVFRDMGLRDVARIDGWVRLDFDALLQRQAAIDNLTLQSKERLEPISEDMVAAEIARLEKDKILDDALMADALDDNTEDEPSQESEQSDAASVSEQAATSASTSDQAAEDADSAADDAAPTTSASEQTAEPSTATEGDKDDIAATEGDKDDDAAEMAALEEVVEEAQGMDFDKWDMYTMEHAQVVIADVNTAMEMSANSLLFVQAAEAGLDHAAVLRHIVNRALTRAGKTTLPPMPPHSMVHSALLPRLRQEWPVHAADNTAEAFELSEPPAVEATSEEEHHPADELPWSEPFEIDHDEEDDDEDDDAAVNAEMNADDAAGLAGSTIAAAAADQVDEHDTAPIMRDLDSDDEDEDEDVVESAAVAQAQSMPRQRAPLKVWVLMGGDSSERQLSLLSGVNAWLQLRQCADLQVEPFLLAPLMGGMRERTRRKELIQKRVDLATLGVDEADIPEELQLVNLRNPIPIDAPPIEKRQVWALPYAIALQRTCEDMLEACERELFFVNRLERTMTIDALSLMELRNMARTELAMAGVEGVASLWGGDPDDPPQPPRLMDLGQFVSEAAEQDAVVFNALHGGMGENGELQSFFEQHNIPFTGCSSPVAEMCNDKVVTGQVLADLEPYGISVTPKVSLTRDELTAVAGDEDAAADLMQDLQERLGVGEQALCVKPASDGGGVGIAAVKDADDLMLYAIALHMRWPYIPEEMLGEERIEMPRYPPAKLLVEPFVETDEFSMPGFEDYGMPRDIEDAYNDDEESQQQSNADDGGVEWHSGTHWLEATCTVLGPQGDAMALTPTIVFKESQQILTAEQRVLASSNMHFTPPPPPIMTEEAVESAQQRFEAVANRLGIDGLARVDAFVHADTGNLYVFEVSSAPLLAASSVVMTQAMLGGLPSGPQYPHQLFRMMVSLAMLRSATTASERLQADEGDEYDNDDTPVGSGGAWSEW